MLFASMLVSFALFSAAVTDSELVSNVRHAIQNDHDLSSYGRSVQVTAENGVVTLTGEVRGEAEKKKIVRLARKTKVTKVNDKLTTTFKNAAN